MENNKRALTTVMKSGNKYVLVAPLKMSEVLSKKVVHFLKRHFTKGDFFNWENRLAKTNISLGCIYRSFVENTVSHFICPR